MVLQKNAQGWSVMMKLPLVKLIIFLITSPFGMFCSRYFTEMYQLLKFSFIKRMTYHLPIMRGIDLDIVR